MIFKPYECDFGITVDGVNYDFDHIVSFNTEDPERTRLIRGSNAGNLTGLIYKEGIKDAKTITVTIIGMTSDIFAVLSQAYALKKRVDCYCVNREDGSSKIAKNAVLSQEPKQLNVDDSPESMNVALAFESFDVSETHKT